MEKEMEIKMSIHDALDTLNPMQREAAVHTEGPQYDADIDLTDY